MTTAAILAGGLARRLGGRDKSTLPIGGRRIIDRQAAALGEVAERLIVVTDTGGRRFGLAGIVTIADLVPGAGALGGLYTALATAAADRTLVVACDLPFLTAAFLRHLLEAGRDVDVALPRTPDGYHPLCASYSRACVEPVRRRIDRAALKVTDLLADVRVREIGPQELAPFDPDGLLLLNVNTPEAYTRACDLAGRPGR